VPFPVYQYMINLVVSLPTRRGPGVLMNVLVGEHGALNPFTAVEDLSQFNSSCLKWPETTSVGLFFQWCSFIWNQLHDL